jgi:hypothetical protein
MGKDIPRSSVAQPRPSPRSARASDDPDDQSGAPRPTTGAFDIGALQAK